MARITRPSDAAAIHLAWAEREGKRLFSALEKKRQAELMRITGGKSLEVFVAKSHAESLRLLREIRASLKRSLVKK